MAKFQIKAVLLTPNGNYTDKEGINDFNTLNEAFENNDNETLYNTLSKYKIENGAIEEHDTNADFIVDCDADGFYFLEKI